MRVLIIGANKITSELAKKLSHKGYEVTLVGTDKSVCDRILSEADIEVIVGDYTDLDFLENNIDLKSPDVVVIATGSDEINLLVAMLARCLGARRIITLMSDSRIARVLRNMGVEVVEFAGTIATLLESVIEGRGTTVDIVESTGTEYKLISYIVSENDRCVGKKVSELKLPHDVKIVAVFDNNELKTDFKDMTLRPGQVLILLARKDAVKHVRDIFKNGHISLSGE